MVMKRGLHRLRFLGAAVAMFLIFLCQMVPAANAQTDEGFSLQVSPSPLVATVKPNTDTNLELQIRNTNAGSQALKMGLRPFTIDETSGQVKLGETVSADVKSLVSFEAPTFTLEAGQIFTQRIRIHADQNKGFSYNFAITISQQNPPKGTKGQSAIAGSVAVFTLINVNKPGAARKFELSSLAVSKHSYEFLPAEITVKLKNTGNINVQPTGTVFIQRHSSDTKPIATLALNDSGGYILPGVSRTFTVAWNDGFPHYETTQNGSKTSQKLVWQSNGSSKIRFGRYVAKIVAIYDDGQRDVPIMAEVSFWVIPWRAILLTGAIVVVLLIGIIVMIRSAGKAARRATRKIHRSGSPHDSSHEI